MLNVDNKNITVSLQNNKLILTKDSVKLLDAVAGDRISINYWTENNELTFPVIGKSELFTDSNDGNRLTKSNTVSYRGLQNEILQEYGKFFRLEPFKTFYKMVAIQQPLDKDNLSNEEFDLKKLEDNINLKLY